MDEFASNGNYNRMSTVLNKLHFVPFVYCFSTRYRTLGTIFAYLTLNIGFCILAITLSQDNVSTSVTALTGYLLTWALFTIIYELGYLMNDSWSAERERVRGCRRAGTQKLVLLLTYRTWTALVLMRIPLVWCLCVCLVENNTFDQNMWVCGVVAMLAVIFVLHNSIFPPHRCVTFAALHGLKYVACVPFLGAGLGVGMFGFLVAPIVAMYTLRYVQSKVSVHREYYARNGIVVTDITACALFVYGVCLIIHNIPFPAAREVIGLYMIYLLAVDFVLRAGLFFQAFRRIEQQDVKYHAHSSYSHDSQLSLGDLRSAMEVRGWCRLYMAEHAEAFSPELYVQYVNQCEAVSGANAMIVPGLEYNVLQQHVLALGLKSYLPIDHGVPADIIRLYTLAERVVWAHPQIALRKLYNLAYVWQTLRIGMMCEAVEWRNRKSDILKRNTLRSRCICLVLCWIRPGRKLIQSEDLHSNMDLAITDLQ